MDLRLFDSTFFVDLDREQRRQSDGPASRFLKDHSEDGMAMSVITRGELARGFATQEAWLDFCLGIQVIPIDDPILWTAAEVFQHLRKEGTAISDNDLWIGATALCHRLPLVTENRRHFDRIPGLTVWSYPDP